MNPLWTASELSEITGATWVSSSADVAGVAYLPRRVKAGDLFVALTYEGFDHHDSVAVAFRQGARAALVSRLPPGVLPTAPLLMAANVPQSLRQLGIAARNRATGKFIGVTGRAGKTFTKDTLSFLLGKQGPTQQTEGNDNDGTGVSITLARLRPSNSYNVVEISMAQRGDIANSVGIKSRVVRPHVAVITRVSGGSSAGEEYRKHHLMIAAGKALICQGLEPGGVVLLNRDDEQVFDFLRERAKELGAAQIQTFGRHAEADIRLQDARRVAAGFEVEISLHGRQLYFTIGVNARQFIENTLAVLGALHAIGADVDQAVPLLAEVHESPGRGNSYRIPVAEGTALLLDYTRNVTLPALHATLGLLAEMTPGPGGRRIAVLSDFMDLDVELVAFRVDLAAVIEKLGIDLVFAMGEDIRPLYDALPEALRGGYAATSDEIAGMVKAALRSGDIVMAQGRRKSQLYRVTMSLVGEGNYVPWR